MKTGRPSKYKDDGCELYPSCANCPESVCVFDQYGGIAAYEKRKRNLEIRKLFEEGKSKKEIALIFGVDRKTVERALK